MHILISIFDLQASWSPFPIEVILKAYASAECQVRNPSGSELNIQHYIKKGREVVQTGCLY